MPGFDGTGPMGAGPMTGGGRGYCNPGNQGVAYGYGRGPGLARGFRGGRGGGRFGAGGGRAGAGVGGYYPAAGPAQTDEVSTLKANAEALRRELEAIHARIAELEKS